MNQRMPAAAAAAQLKAGRDALLVVGKSATMMAEFCYFLGVHTSVTHKTKIAQRQPLPPNRCNNFTTIITIYQ
jgi:hypothetical protein